MTEFPRAIFSNLGTYVYLYIDPRSNKVFYVGKGTGNRAFSHLSDDSESEKVRYIQALREQGLVPLIEILVHGLTDDAAKKVEASTIDLLGIETLTNIQRGYESRSYGRMGCDQILSLYVHKKVVITEPCILVKINQSFRHGMGAVELYDATRSAWPLGPDKDKAVYAMAIYEGIVQEVYSIAGWFKNTQTFNTRKSTAEPDKEARWEFVGNIAPNEIRNKYLLADVTDYIGPRFPIDYVNIKTSRESNNGQ
jgi:hypothetical protein